MGMYVINKFNIVFGAGKNQIKHTLLRGLRMQKMQYTPVKHVY